jgi:cation diffusion facilitator family transporter
MAPSPPRDPHSFGTVDADTRVTVVLALAVNLVIATAKVVGGLLSGSPALLSEAAHSVADSFNELFLLAAVARSRRTADARHPFGYGKERFFWSMLAAVAIFVTGACFSLYQGLHTLLGDANSEPSAFRVGFAVLGVAFAAEAISFARAVTQAVGEARRRGTALGDQLRGGDPALRTVLAEDGAALIGVLLAAGGMAAHAATGSIAWEAAASLAIAVLLALIAFHLGRDSKDLLIGEAADPTLRQAAYRFLAEQPGIDTVVALLTMQLGPDSALLVARVDLADGFDSDGVEEASERVKAALRHEFPMFRQVYLDIADATDADREQAAVRLGAPQRDLSV